jgi:methylated-DNA-[protein]-cysteine S-methyltransferase
MNNDIPRMCREIQDDLLAAAMREAEPPALRRVEEHVGRCGGCRGELKRYRAVDEVVDTLRGESASAAHLALARAELASRLGDLRSRLVRYRVFPSPLGRVLIARSEGGVALVEFLGGGVKASRLARAARVEAWEDGAEIDALYRELLEYLGGRRTELRWAVDLRLARSPFHREVLEVTARIPYGAVTSYAGVARELGRPRAVRAVAQALRWNPVPIRIPCHRVIGASGFLTGYAGNKLTLKQQLLSLEGIRAQRRQHDFRVPREAMYVRHRDDVAYCLPTCGSLPSLTLAQLTLFASRERAESAGLVPCRTCRPDLHPISQ